MPEYSGNTQGILRLRLREYSGFHSVPKRREHVRDRCLQGSSQVFPRSGDGRGIVESACLIDGETRMLRDTCWKLFSAAQDAEMPHRMPIFSVHFGLEMQNKMPSLRKCQV